MPNRNWCFKAWVLRHKEHKFVLGQYCYDPKDRSGLHHYPMFRTREAARQAKYRLLSYRNHSELVNVIVEVRSI